MQKTNKQRNIFIYVYKYIYNIYIYKIYIYIYISININKIEFQNSVARFVYFVPYNGHQDCLDKSLNTDICDMVKHEIRVTSCELQFTSYELKA